MGPRADLDDERVRAAMNLVDRALDLGHDEREAELDRELDSQVRDMARAMLAADASNDPLMEKPAATLLPSAVRSLAAPAASGAAVDGRVGAFRLLSLLGRGGMGEVWLAERDEADFVQKVAIKLLFAHLGSSSTASRARFGRERRILAQLSHPRIAGFVDGGITADGVPWLAMEYVDGLPLTEHCTELELEARLRLFIEVCEGVRHAHQNLIVHRDLKPSNVLVDREGNPKLLDFGIAKLVGTAGASTSLTKGDERPMTPEYASPEQQRGEGVTTASDVWTLGAILFELLTGARVDRELLDTPKARPSAQMSNASRRPANLTAAELRNKLRGDLDAIVLKALRGDPKQRYGSVDALMNDVRAYLSGTPVSARGDATSYLLWATLRRHRTAVVAALIVLASLVAGMGGTFWQARRAREEARRAEQGEAFLIDMVATFDPEKGGRALTQIEILERGEANLDASLADQPVERGRLLRVFAQTWLDLSMADRALAAGEKALALQRANLRKNDDEIAKTLILLSDTHTRLGEPAKAEAADSEALAIAVEAEGPWGPTVADATSNLGRERCSQNRFDEGVALNRRAVDIFRHNLGDDAGLTLEREADLAVCLGDQGLYADDVAINRRAAAGLARTRGATHPTTILTRHNLAVGLIGLGQCAEAETILRDVLRLQREVLGTDFPLGGTKRWLALALDCNGRSDEALVLLDEARETYAVNDGPHSLMVRLSLLAKAQTLRHVHRLADAETAAREALAMFPDPTDNARSAERTRAMLGGILLDEGHPAEAKVELVRAVAYLEANLPLQSFTHEARADLDRASTASSAPP